MQLPGPDYPAPAKLNLFLHVVGRRTDNYHLLQSAFTLLELHDRVRLRVRGDGAIGRANDVEGIAEEADLAVRAAKLLREESGSPLGADIEIDKRIPVGGGLGGGSSDAATVLWVLDRLWGLGWGPDRLRPLGARLGADVPFFLYGRTAWVEGVGERLQPLEIEPRWYVVLVPPVAVPTQEIFQAPELTRDTEPLKIQDFSAQPEASAFHNDLQPVVCARYPEVLGHLQWLAERGKARVTGSGGCVFAGYDTREQAQAVLDALPAPMRGFVTRAISRHPLAALA